MINDNHREEIIKSFPEFQKTQGFVDEVLELGKFIAVPKGNTIIDVDDYIKVIPLLMNGLIKIYREDDDGNEILLYYIKSGESCVISITSSIKYEKSSIRATTEEDSTIFAIPSHDFLKLLNKYNLLHTFTYDLFNVKYNELIKSIDCLAFSDMRTRLYHYLETKANLRDTKIITGLTHKEIAKDLATSREVISRLLYALSKDGKITIKNKEITLSK